MGPSSGAGKTADIEAYISSSRILEFQKYPVNRSHHNHESRGTRDRALALALAAAVFESRKYYCNYLRGMHVTEYSSLIMCTVACMPRNS